MRPSLEHCQATGGWEGGRFQNTSPQQRPHPLPVAVAFVDTDLKAAALPAAFWGCGRSFVQFGSEVWPLVKKKKKKNESNFLLGTFQSLLIQPTSGGGEE